MEYTIIQCATIDYFISFGFMIAMFFMGYQILKLRQELKKFQSMNLKEK